MNNDEKNKGLVPRLRFPGFEGEWLLHRFFSLYDFKRTNSLSRDKLNYTNGTIKNIHYGDIHTKFRTIFHIADAEVPYINPEISEAYTFTDDEFCEEGDLVLADASEDMADIGKAIEIVSLEGEKVVAGTHTILASRRGNEPILGFGGYLFQSPAVRIGIQKQSQGTKVFGISAKRISSILLPLPPSTSEQQRIADCLSSLDDLISAETRKLEGLRAHKKGLMQQLFPREGETVPRLRFPGFEGGGEWTSINSEEIFDEVNNKEHNSDLPVLAITQEYGAIPRNAIDYYVSVTQDSIKNYKVVEIGDFIISLRSFEGGIEFSNYRGICSPAYVIIRLRNKHFQGYLRYYLKSGQFILQMTKDLEGIRDGKLISYKKFSKMKLSLPPSIAEQQRIADCLSSLDDLIAAQARKVELLKQHKKGLMQQLFPRVE